MHILRYLAGDVPAICVAVADGWRSVEGVTDAFDVLDMNAAALRGALQSGARVEPAGMRCLAPIDVRRIFGVGSNYPHPASPIQGKLPFPEVFSRFASTIVAHGDPIERPREIEQLMFGAELALIIGRRGRRISAAEAFSYIAGYSIFNDTMLLDFLPRSSQWGLAKNFDRSAPFGPVLATPDELPDEGLGVRIETLLNDRIVQQGMTDDMYYTIPEILVEISATVTLDRGDIITTGTPASESVYLAGGDVCECRISGIGVLRNPAVDEPG
jgi:acylpyruvate hydrolase